MYEKTVKYVDYNGVERTETHCFNLNKAEIMEMEMSTTGGMEKMITKITSEQDSKKIMELFKDIVLKSYGVKSDDGKRFIKNDQLREEFSQTEAYVEIFMELATNADAAAAFVNGIVPQALAQEAAKAQTNKFIAEKVGN